MTHVTLEQAKKLKELGLKIDKTDEKILSNHNFYLGTSGYLQTNIVVKGKRTTRYLHWFLLSPKKGLQIDHINHDRLDNRRTNLRYVSPRQNCFNRKALSKSNLKGVNWHKSSRKWRARIVPRGKEISLGYFSDKFQAALAYNEAAKKYFGDYAFLNSLVLEQKK